MSGASAACGSIPTSDSESSGEESIQSSDSEFSGVESVLSSDTDSEAPRKDCTTKIVVQCTDNEFGRKYDKRQDCFVGKIPQSKLPRHFKAHSDDTDVKDYLEEEDAERKKAKYSKLRNLGNFVHNREVVKQGFGTFVVSHRPSKEAVYTDYDVCVYCFATLVKF